MNTNNKKRTKANAHRMDRDLKDTILSVHESNVLAIQQVFPECFRCLVCMEVFSAPESRYVMDHVFGEKHSELINNLEVLQNLNGFVDSCKNLSDPLKLNRFMMYPDNVDSTYCEMCEVVVWNAGDCLSDHVTTAAHCNNPKYVARLKKMHVQIQPDKSTPTKPMPIVEIKNKKEAVVKTVKNAALKTCVTPLKQNGTNKNTVQSGTIAQNVKAPVPVPVLTVCESINCTFEEYLPGKYRCWICNTVVSGEANLRLHAKGKNHLGELAKPNTLEYLNAFNDAWKNIKEKYKLHKFLMSPSSTITVYCEVCQDVVSNSQSALYNHFLIPKHKKEAATAGITKQIAQLAKSLQDKQVSVDNKATQTSYSAPALKESLNKILGATACDQVQQRDVSSKIRSDATFSFCVLNISTLTYSVHSKVCYIRNLPWRILVKPSTILQIGVRSLGFFLQCNTDNDSPDWSCYASATLKLNSQKPGGKPFTRHIRHLFNSKENDMGFAHFMALHDIVNPDKGYVMNDSIILEVHVTANVPSGVCSDSNAKTDSVESQLKINGRQTMLREVTVATQHIQKVDESLIEELSPGIYKCLLCVKEFPNYHNMIQHTRSTKHMNMITSEKGKTVKELNNLGIVHSTESQLKTNGRQTVLREVNVAIQHIQKVDESLIEELSPGIYKCKLCVKEFPSNHHMIQHTHSKKHMNMITSEKAKTVKELNNLGIVHSTVSDIQQKQKSITIKNAVPKMYITVPLLDKSMIEAINGFNNYNHLTIQRYSPGNYRCLVCQLLISGDENVFEHVRGAAHGTYIEDSNKVKFLDSFHSLLACLDIKYAFNMYMMYPKDMFSVHCEMCDTIVRCEDQPLLLHLLQNHITSKIHLGNARYIARWQQMVSAWNI